MADKTIQVLLAGDAPSARDLVAQTLESGLGEVLIREADGREQLAAALADACPDVVITNYQLRGITGLEVVDLVLRHSSDIPVIVLTSTKAEDVAVEAMKLDGTDYAITSVQQIARLPATVVQLLERRDAVHAMRRAHDALARNEAKYRNLVNHLPVVIYTAALDEASTTQFVSPQIQDLLDYSPEDFHRNPDIWRERLHPDDRERVLQEMSRAHEDGRDFASEYRMIRRDGKTVHVSDDAGLVYDSDGNPVLQQGVMLDITERKQAEETVREQARLLDLIFEHSLDSIVLLDKDYNFIRVSEAYAKACQRDSSEFPGHNHFEFYPSNFQDEADEARKEKRIYRKSARPFVFPDHPERGTTYWDLGLVPILDKDKEIELFLFTLKDVTERVQTTKALSQSVETFELVMNSIDACVYVADMDTHEILFANQKLCDQFEPDDDLVGKICWQALHDGQTGPCEFCTNNRLVDVAGKPSETFLWEVQNPKAGGWYELRDRAIRWPDGRLVRLEIATDITKRKKNEQELRRRGAILESVSHEAEQLLSTRSWREAIPDLLEKLGTATEVSRVYIFQNHVSETGELLMSQCCEWTAQDINSATDRTELTNLPYRACGAERWMNLMADGKVVYGAVRNFPACEQEVLTPQGILSVVAVPLFANSDWWGFIGFDECTTAREWTSTEIDALKAAAGILGAAIQRGLLEDQLEQYALHLQEQVEERADQIRKLERQRSAMEKLAATGRMAAGVAHEINNPLGGIKNCLLLLKDGIPSEKHYQHYMAMAEGEVNRISNIVRQLYQLYEPRAHQASEIDIRQTIDDIVSTLEHQLSQRKLRIEVTVSPKLQLTRLVKADFVQILYNLLLNAIQAAPATAAIKVVARPNWRKLHISVTNPGAGIPPEVLPHIFEPFYSTKDDSDDTGGMGLGLAISQELAASMGGRIEVKTGIGKETTFTLVLPRNGKAKRDE